MLKLRFKHIEITEITIKLTLNQPPISPKPRPHRQLEHQNFANIIDNERFELQNVVSTVEMAASSSKMWQIARKTDRTGNFKFSGTHQFTSIPQRIPDPIIGDLRP